MLLVCKKCSMCVSHLGSQPGVTFTCLETFELLQIATYNTFCPAQVSPPQQIIFWPLSVNRAEAERPGATVVIRALEPCWRISEKARAQALCCPAYSPFCLPQSPGSPWPACHTELAARLLEGIGSIETAVFHADPSPKEVLALARRFLILGEALYRVWACNRVGEHGQVCEGPRHPWGPARPPPTHLWLARWAAAVAAAAVGPALGQACWALYPCSPAREEAWLYVGWPAPRVSGKEEPGAGGTRRAKGSVGGEEWGEGRVLCWSLQLQTLLATSVPELPPLLSPPYFLPHSCEVLLCLSPYPPAPQAPPSNPWALNQCTLDKFLLREKWSLEVGSKIELPHSVTLSKSLEPLWACFPTYKKHALYHNDRANPMGVLNISEVSAACSACPASWGGAGIEVIASSFILPSPPPSSFLKVKFFVVSNVEGMSAQSKWEGEVARVRGEFRTELVLSTAPGGSWGYLQVPRRGWVAWPCSIDYLGWVISAPLPTPYTAYIIQHFEQIWIN